ncbi:hypothetical protein JY452_05840, partial [Stenotrophomonas maltophilia]|nr:hypothetical protein [Stenotrophomonas maltophilia]
ARQLNGYPGALLAGVAMNSNALAMLTLLNLAHLWPGEPVLAWMNALHHQFGGVLPELEPLTPHQPSP